MITNPDNSEQYLTVREACKLLSIHPDTFRKLIVRKGIKPVILINRKLYKLSDLQKMFEV